MSSARHERVSSVFLAAARAEPARRAALLESECGDDFELRREVESLLAHHDETSEGLDTPLFGEQLRLASLASEQDSAETGRPAPAQIGRYRILSVLGEGGMGVVYLAEQDKPRRTVALKLIRSGVASERALRRFEHESHVLGRLQHPGIAQILEAGTAELPSALGPRTQPYFAMEYVRGRPLLEYITASALTHRAKLALFVQLCQAVHHAHQHGVIHRDLKPANILVDADGRARILDFGVARSTDADVHATTLQTDIGQLIGTIPYMSPEQASGDAARVDARSDVYSLGVILYEMLTGRLPHDLRGRTIPEAVRLLAHNEPTPLSSIDRSLRGDLNTIAAKALEKDRDRRYQSASELALDVQRYLDHQPIIARPASAAYQFSKFARRNLALVGGIAAVFIVLVAGLIATALLLARALQAEKLALERRDQAASAQQAATDKQREAERSASRERAVNKFLQEALSAADPLQKAKGYTLVQMLDDAADELRRGSMKEEPEIEATLHRVIGNSYRTLGEYDKAAPHLVAAVELQRSLPARSLELAGALNSLGLLRQEQEHYDESLQLHEEAIQIHRDAGVMDTSDAADVLNNLGLVQRYRGLRQESETSFRAALDVYRGVNPPEPVDIARTLSNLAALLREESRLQEAEPLVREAVEILKANYGPEHPLVAISHHSLASLRSAQGDRAEAETHLRESVRISRATLGDHPQLASELNDLALAIKGQGRLAEAAPIYAESLEIRRRVLGEDHPATGQTMINIAALYREMGRLSEAEAMARQALEIRRRRVGMENPESVSSANILAMILWEQGRLEEAESMHRELLAIRQRILGPDHVDVAHSLSNLSVALRDAGKTEQAEQLNRDALAIYQARLGDSHPMTVGARNNLTAVMLARERFDEAIALGELVLQERRAMSRPNPIEIANSLALLASCRMKRGAGEDFAAAEPLLRESLEVRTRSLPAGSITIFITRSQLGECLGKLQRFEEAEPLLLESHAAMRSNPGTSPQRLKAALERIIVLYEAWQKPQEAAQYRAMLAEPASVAGG